MCSALESALVGVSIARLIELTHRGLFDVGEGDCPLVVLVSEDRADDVRDRSPVSPTDKRSVHRVITPTRRIQGR